MIPLILKKFLAFLLDFFVFAILCIPVSLLYRALSIEEVDSASNDLLALFWYLIFLFYPTLMEYRFHATLGHLAVGLKIVRIDGTQITLLTAFKRRFPDIVELILTSGLVALFLNLTTDGYRRLGDLWAKTVVIEKRSEAVS